MAGEGACADDGCTTKTTSLTLTHRFVGFIGTITGVSDKQMAISEIGVTFPDDSFGKEVRARKLESPHARA